MAQLYMVIVSTNYDIRGRAEGCQPGSGALFIALLIQRYARTEAIDSFKVRELVNLLVRELRGLRDHINENKVEGTSVCGV
jgi:hypothetical protein